MSDAKLFRRRHEFPQNCSRCCTVGWMGSWQGSAGSYVDTGRENAANAHSLLSISISQRRRSWISYASSTMRIGNIFRHLRRVSYLSPITHTPQNDHGFTSLTHAGEAGSQSRALFLDIKPSDPSTLPSLGPHIHRCSEGSRVCN